MIEKTLGFFQIYYKEDQLGEIYSFAKPVYNQALTPYFENSIIATLVPKCSTDLVSIASWKLKQKRNIFPSNLILKQTGSSELTQEGILAAEFDVAILTPRLPEHKMLLMAEHWHGRSWVDSFRLLTLFLKKRLGLKVPNELAHPIYGNHFIARGEIYREYVQSCLIPTIHFMENNVKVFSQNAGYRTRKSKSEDVKEILDYETATARKDWPIGVFLLERLFSIWINEKKLHLINL